MARSLASWTKRDTDASNDTDPGHGRHAPSRSRRALPTGPDRLEGAGRFGRNPSYDVPNNRASRPLLAAMHSRAWRSLACYCCSVECECESEPGAQESSRASSRASAAEAQDARSLLRQWRRRMPDAHRRRDVADPVGDRRQHGRDGPAALSARSRLRRGTRPDNPLRPNHAELVPMRFLDRAHVRERAFSDVLGWAAAFCSLRTSGAAEHPVCGSASCGVMSRWSRPVDDGRARGASGRAPRRAVRRPARRGA
jgi:hypothetical protein